MYNIGLIVGNVEDSFSNHVCKGAMRAAEEMGDSLFVFPVKYLNMSDVIKSDAKQRFEYQYNFLLGYVQSHSLDMIIFSSTIAYQTSHEEFMNVVKGCGDIPVLLLASDEKGYSSIMFRNTDGLKKGIQYLIDESGCRHIGMIAGSPDNKDGRERYEAYREALQENGLKFEPEMVVYGDFSEHCEEQVEELLKNNPDLDAIVCTNDSTAMGTYMVLNKHNIEIGKDICVLGFDDVDGAAKMNPPLATVRADAACMGYRAVESVHNILNDRGVDKNRALPIRKLLVDTEFINRESAGGPKKKLSIEDSLSEQKYYEMFQRMTGVNHCINILTRDMLMYCDTGAGNFSYFLEAFHLEKNTCCYLFMLEEPQEYYAKADYRIEKKLYLKAYKLNEKIYELANKEKQIALDDLFKAECFEKKPKNYIVIDIYTCEMQYGIMVCDLTYKDFIYTENLCYLIGISTKIFHLLYVQEQLLAEKEEMLKKLEQENLILGDISYKDELTGINNRRGFIAKTMDMIKDKTNIGKMAAVVYVDLNYLKLINDRFSHAEGNIAIQTCAKALSYVCGEVGIAGRIGGDEFAMFMLITYSGDGECLRQQIKDFLVQYNQSSDRPYEVAVSIGIQEIIIDSDCDLKKVLGMADKKLYEDKANKKPFAER